MEQKKSSQDRGQFNLDYEESVLLRSRLGSINKALDKIVEKIDAVLHGKSSLSTVDEDNLIEAKKIARGAKK